MLAKLHARYRKYIHSFIEMVLLISALPCIMHTLNPTHESIVTSQCERGSGWESASNSWFTAGKKRK
jgi:hypothetical protein